MAKPILPLDFRKEKIFHVKPARSAKNNFSGITIPQHPQMAPNDFNSAHQDSYCSESVSLAGPTTKTVKLITQYHPFGLFTVMGCNSNGQMIATGVTDAWRLVVFDADCRFISVTTLISLQEAKTATYFYINSDDNAVIVVGNQVKCFPTANVAVRDEVYPLQPLWSSGDIVQLITGSADGNQLYCAMPVWGSPNKYWCVLAGIYNMATGVLSSNAIVAVVQITPGTSKGSKSSTTLLASMDVKDCWNNNSIAVDETGMYAVFNKTVDSSAPADTGLLAYFTFDGSNLKMRWGYDYESCGRLLVGQINIGSGTTPTVTIDKSGKKCVNITDNDSPRVNVVVVDATAENGGKLVSQTPVFSKMRSCNDASLIAVSDSIVVENNFGHTLDQPYPQYVSNEPGMALVKSSPSSSGQVGGPGEIVWENTYTTYFGMSTLARKSGIIFAYSGSWYDPHADSEVGPEYSIVAVDSFDGRIIWRIPVGRGALHCHEYGGFYFNRKNNSVYVGANGHIYSIQEVDESKYLP